MILSDIDILRALDDGDILVDPFDAQLVGPASLDVRLGAEIMLPVGPRHLDMDCRGGWSLPPLGFCLAVTLERVKLSVVLAAQLSGRSTWGRKGLAVHITAGWIDPGWDGRITYELFNHSAEPIKLTAGDVIAQLVFHPVITPSSGYKGRYQGATTVEAAKASS